MILYLRETIIIKSPIKNFMKKVLLFILAICMFQTSMFAQTTEFSDDFESGTAQWTLEGAWGLTTTQSNSPSNSLTDSPVGNYAAGLNISATMTTGVDLSAALDAELNFSAIYDIEDGNFDYCYVEASGDGGATWINVATIFGQGNLSPWVDYTYSLGGFSGASDVKVRFRFFSDGGFEVDGIYIDDVSIVSFDTDNGVPLVIHTPTALYESTPGDITLTAELIDISGIGSATAFYSVDGGAAASVSGTNTSGNFYDFVIPEQAAGAQVDYFLEAVDASANTNSAATSTFSYIAGQHIFYDNGVTDFITSFGPTSAGNLGAAVRFTLSGNDIKYALIRNYTDQNNPNDDFMFHIWADDNGLPGADLITPFMVTPEANLTFTSPMTRIDLSPYAAQLSNLGGDVFMGYTVPSGETFLTQTTPGIGGRTYVQDGNGTWAINAADDYHFRIVTTVTVASDDCSTATNINGLLGAGVGVSVSSPIFTNVDATTDASDPTTGWECFGEPDGGGSAPSLENTQWFTFVGDGNTYSIITTDCGGTVTDYIDFGDTQIAIYSGADCANLTPVACNEDVAGTDPNGPYPAGLDFETQVGVTYFLMVDGFLGSDGEYCIEFTEVAVISCDDIAVGTSATTSNAVCFGEMATISLTGNTVIPILANLNGFVWGVSTIDITDSSDPFAAPAFLGSFGGILPAANEVTFTNDANLGLPAGLYYFTPIVLGGTVDTDGTFANLDFSGGCVLTGISLAIEILPEYTALSVTSSSVDETIPPGNNGEATVVPTGGSSAYTYLWDNGATTATITGLAAGDYTVTVSDATGCVADVVITVTVGVISGTEDLAFAQAVKMFPNPAKGQTNIQYDFSEGVDLQISLTNSLGQVVFERLLPNTQNGTLDINLQNYSTGIYFAKMSDGIHQTTRRLVVSK